VARLRADAAVDGESSSVRRSSRAYSHRRAFCDPTFSQRVAGGAHWMTVARMVT
jgi:hypothetical protein